jgi:hypothetical protein
MPARIDCPSCRKPINVADALVGKAIRCPHCQMVIPGAASQSAAAGSASPAAIAPAPVILDVLPAGPADVPGQPFPPYPPYPPPKQDQTALVVVLAVLGVFLFIPLLIVVCLAAIQFLGSEASVTFSTIGSSISSAAD